MTSSVADSKGGKVAPPAHSFQRRIGPFDATMLVAGSMIGSGIFLVSADISRDVGSAGGLLAVWLVTGLLTVCGALSYGELAAMMPKAGGQYVYLREAYSPLWGFLYGWTLFLVIQTGTIAAVGVAFAKFLGVIAPALGTGEAGVLLHVPMELHLKLNLPWLQRPLAVLDRTKFEVSAGQLVGAGVVVLLTALNCLGVQQGKIVQNIFTVAKTLALVVVILIGLTVAANSAALAANMHLFWNTPATPHQVKVEELAGVGSALGWLMVAGGAMVGSLFSSDAWNNITFAAGEVREPRRTLPLSLICGTGLVTTLYLLANVGYLCALPVSSHIDETKKLELEARLDQAAASEMEAEARLLASKATRAKAQAALEDRTSSEGNDLQTMAKQFGEQADQLREYADKRYEKRFDDAVAGSSIAGVPDGRVGTAIVQQAFPGYGAPIMAIAIMVSTFGCMNGLILAGARLYWAMARDGLFFRPAGTLNGRGVPAVGLILQAVWSVVLIFSGTYSELLDYVIFAALLFYVLTVGGLFVLRFTRPEAERPYRALGYPVLPLLYILVSGIIMLDLLIVKPSYTWPGLAIVLTGVPAYLLWRTFGRQAPAVES
jgi:amino acid transporter